MSNGYSEIDKLNEVLYQCLQETNDINSQYCDEYDRFFSQKLGEEFDFIRVANEMNNLFEALDQINVTKSLDEYFKHNNLDLKIPDILISFQDLLIQRILLLQNICSKLSIKSSKLNKHDPIDKVFLQSISNKKYSFHTYRADIKKLEKYEKTSIEVGSVLQNLAEPFMLRVKMQMQSIVSTCEDEDIADDSVYHPLI